MFASYFAPRWRVLVVASVLGLAAAWSMRARSTNFAEAVADVRVDRGSVVFFDAPSTLRPTRVFFLGTDESGARDVFLARVRAVSETHVLSVLGIWNLTRTGGADEVALSREGNHLYFLTQTVGGYSAVTRLSVDGEDRALTASWGTRAKLQNGVTNLLETSQWKGIGRERFVLVEPCQQLALVDAADLRVRCDDEQETLGENPAFAEGIEQAKGVPGTITWLVDTIRGLSFVGPEPIAWLESRVFAVKDFAERIYYRVAGGPDTASEVAEELGLSASEVRARAALSVPDPEIGWPPQAVVPTVANAARGEGEWVAVTSDPFVGEQEGAPPAFVTTFLQVDPERPFTRVYIVAWDPRQVQLRVMTGTVEPESATGETGSGRIPRDDETLRRVVGGFNGGFQSLHGEFGMMSEGRVYLPPKPWAATVAVFRDGQVALGSWTDPPEGVRSYAERWALEQIPADMVEFRQNLTSVVEDGTWNPWGRWYWGAAPQNVNEQVYVDRSGVCVTQEGHMAYFWGRSMGAEELGRAMTATRCARGMHLDMNTRHTGFEFYRTYRADAPLPELDRPLRDDFEFDTAVEGAPSWRARGRLLSSSMTPMRFPRYIRTDQRDYFYLTLRPILPGRPLAQGIGFSSEGLPHAGWPPTFARAAVGASWLVRVDPARMTHGIASATPTAPLLGWLLPAEAGPRSLSSVARTVGTAFVIQDGTADGALLTGAAPDADSEAAVTVDSDGFLVYVEGEDVAQQVEALGGSAPAIEVAGLVFALADGTVSGADGFVRELPPGGVPIFGNASPRARVLFPDTAPRPYRAWAQMQDARVRYIRDPEAPARFTSGGDPAANGAPNN